MKRTLLSILLMTAFACGSSALLAKGAPSGGHSATHVSEQARLNSNGPNTLDRDKGQDRAEDRRSAQATANATAHVKHKKKAVVARNTTTRSPNTTTSTTTVRTTR